MAYSLKSTDALRFGAFRESHLEAPENTIDVTQKKNVKKVLTLSALPAYTRAVNRKRMTPKQVARILKNMQGDRSNRQFAFSIGISPAHLGDIYSGKRNPGEKILSQLGLAKRAVKSAPVYEAV